MPADESSQAEIELLKAWDENLTKLFLAVDSGEPGLLEEGLDQERIRGYRQRVGQDLQAFQEKLANIMESEKSGQ
ncbi:MAG: hypothetical protein KC800_22075 [Candidatus Eremiobacteraeota bacterium]|nr:hypothetical protein [Candidatus Eremiobacteraeota bacterium]